MLDDLIITYSIGIIKFLRKLDFDILFTTPQLKHIVVFVIAMILKGYNGKVSDVEELTSHRHRTCTGKLLNKSPWDETFLLEALRKHAIKRI